MRLHDTAKTFISHPADAFELVFQQQSSIYSDFQSKFFFAKIQKKLIDENFIIFAKQNIILKWLKI